MKKKLTEWQQEYHDSNYRRKWSPRYIDFEFYKVEFVYVIHYIAEKDKVYGVVLGVAEFNALMEGINLNRNPFGDQESDTTPDYIWKIIAAYCRTYGSGMTKKKAQERLHNIYFEEQDGSKRLGTPVRMSRAELKYRTDTWSKQGFVERNRAEPILTGIFDTTPAKEKTA